MEYHWRSRNFAYFYSQQLTHIYLCSCFLLLTIKLEVLFLNLLPLIFQFILQRLQLPRFLLKALFNLQQAHSVLLVLFVLKLNLVKHLVYTSDLLSQSIILFAHVILQIDQF